MKLSWSRIGVFIILGVVLLWGATFSYKLIKWKGYVWAPNYFASLIFDEETARTIPDSQRHILFLLCNHYEPGLGEEGAQRNQRWLEKFKRLSDQHRDSAGNRFQNTCFYPYDHKNERVLEALAEMVREGYGEVELHWHHPRELDNNTFPISLDEAIAWFQKQGLFVTSGKKAETRFAFIHGDWALDASNHFCKVTREPEILFSRGCYADFTFPAIGNCSQPRRVNSIYYVEDNDGAKSYDDGIPVVVGRSISNRLMIFEGPSTISWTGKLEYGAVESDLLPTRERIGKWIDTNIHVPGRPGWVFIKVYSHGIQSEKDILDAHLERMLTDLENICKERGMSLHYVTAREAYNMVKAAEEGLEGNPEAYRNYRIPPPLIRGAKKEK